MLFVFHSGLIRFSTKLLFLSFFFLGALHLALLSDFLPSRLREGCCSSGGTGRGGHLVARKLDFCSSVTDHGRGEQGCREEEAVGDVAGLSIKVEL